MKRLLICIMALAIAVMPALTACGDQGDGGVASAEQNGAAATVADREDGADASEAGSGDEDVRQLRFDLSSEAKDELQKMLAEKDDGGIFWIEPVRA